MAQLLLVWGEGILHNFGLTEKDQSCVSQCFDQSHLVPKVLGLLVSLLFSVPGLDWSPIDHLETFAGCKAVTAAECEVHGFKSLFLRYGFGI